ncbi:ABC transporter permease [Nigerium massiliense]|uniref:ABC transporter permease n=1 Tax=Nigerium massiliense TaxID=1522317 RepID=UPI00058FD509|nr:ABC transporter permease [Nigerium massiliense]
MVLLVVLAMAASHVGRLGLARTQGIAAVRAIVQLAAISLVITAAVQTIWGGLAINLVMFAVAVFTTTGRVDARRAWPWTALAMLAGIVPVMLVIFLTGAAPLNGLTLVALGGIITGNMMNAHTLAGRRCFAELRDNIPVYEAALSLGFERRLAVSTMLQPVLGEALLPNIDQTRTVGLVTLPGAFIGVLLGGGSPIQAGASQLLVLFGIMAGQVITVVAARQFMQRGKLLPDDLRESLHA